MYNVREGISLDFRLIQKEVFTTYVFQGISAEHNAILFELPTADLLHTTSGKESLMKIKLAQKVGVIQFRSLRAFLLPIHHRYSSFEEAIPHLVIELETIDVRHEIPVNFIIVKNWSDYEPPNVGLFSVSKISEYVGMDILRGIVQAALNLPSVKVIHKMLTTIKNIGARTLVKA